jgi:hypothetical protein
MSADRKYFLTRRRIFLLAGAGVASWLPLGAATADFWNKKEPADWTTEEIDRLLTKSPWAKQVKAHYAPGEEPTGDDVENSGGTTTRGRYPGGSPGAGGGYPGGGTSTGTGGYPGGAGRTSGGISLPGIGGLPIPGLGGKGRGRGNGGGVASPYEGTVRWESARPILEAMKSPLPEAFKGRYVISVSGIPLLRERSMGPVDEDDSTASRRHEKEDIDRLKDLSSLEARGRDPVQAGLVTRQVATGSSFLFGFSRELLPLEKRDTDFLFTTTLGRLVVKAHFVPKEMLYHGELSV